MGKDSGKRICAAALQLLDDSGDAAKVTIRRVAGEVGLTPMAIYKHFASRDELLKAATLTEYERIGGYFQRANARRNIKGLRGMLGYLDYALDHPNLFRYMFASARDDAYVFPHDLNSGKSSTMNILHAVVEDAMKSDRMRRDDVFEVSLTIWAHAHGLIALYLAGRINLSQKKFRDLYLRSLNRLLDGLLTRDNSLGS